MPELLRKYEHFDVAKVPPNLSFLLLFLEFVLFFCFSFFFFFFFFLVKWHLFLRDKIHSNFSFFPDLLQSPSQITDYFA